MHVVSASRRTDIPAFHAEWFMRRVREKYALVRSPFGGGLHEVSLAPQDVTAVVFWTKNAAPLVPHLKELHEAGHCFTFLYTVNNYPAHLEPRVPHWSHTLKTLGKIRRGFPGAVIRWRYDTVVFDDVVDRSWHMKNFSFLCGEMAAFSTECIFSFCDYYKKTIKNMELRVPTHYRPDESGCKDMAEEMAEVARSCSIKLSSCAHDFLVSDAVAKAQCISPEVLLRVVDSPIRADAVRQLKAAPSRKECGCVASRDVGAYDTCLHGCVYCYANTNPEASRSYLEGMGNDSPCLDPRVAVRAPLPYHHAEEDLTRRARGVRRRG